MPTVESVKEQQYQPRHSTKGKKLQIHFVIINHTYRVLLLLWMKAFSIVIVYNKCNNEQNEKSDGESVEDGVKTSGLLQMNDQRRTTEIKWIIESYKFVGSRL